MPSKKAHSNSKKHFTAGTYIMHGKHPVLSAIQNKNRIIKNIFCIDKIYQQHMNLLKNFNTKIVDAKFLQEKAGDKINHQGIIALVEKLPKISSEDFISNGPEDRILILDQITDPQNIGAIIRSAAAFGVKKIALPENNSPEENATIAKAACGCLELVKLAKITNISKFISLVKKHEYWVVGLDGNGTENLSQITKIQKLVIVIGSEDKGMRRLTKENCDFIAKIPIAQGVESLNASCAASIILYALQL